MIKLIIDSTSDFTYEEANDLGLVYLPITVSFGDIELKEGIDISKSEFYNRMIDGNSLPKTSQITPFQYTEAIDKVLENGDTPVIITLSSNLSGTYSSAMIAASNYDNVYVVDSENASIGEKILILYAINEIKNGCNNPEELVDKINQKKKKIGIFFLVDTLTYLQKGGRISKFSSLTGNLLSVKPLLTLVDNEIVVAAKSRGFNKGHLILKDKIEERGYIDYNQPFLLAYSGDDISVLDKYIGKYEDIFNTNIKNIPIVQIGSSVGTHLGPNSVGVAFFYK